MKYDIDSDLVSDQLSGILKKDLRRRMDFICLVCYNVTYENSTKESVYYESV